MNSVYIGHSAQISGVEEVSLCRGKGKGMTLLEVRNGKGLQFTLSADRAMDVSRMQFNGANMGYFSPSGYVHPAYYDSKGAGFLKSFTAGFLTTCGLCAVGSPCTDDGEELPLHGSISNTPCENYSYEETETEIIIRACVRDAAIFGNQLLLHRTFICSKTENVLKIEDVVENIGGKEVPCMLLYHFNMGYPLLTENAIVAIPHNTVSPRDAHAEEDIQNCLSMEKPQAGYQERCYYYDLKEKDNMAAVGIFNPDIEKGLIMKYDKKALDCFVEWKMMGEREYVLGLEPANCTPDGRDVVREKGILKFIAPGKTYKTNIEIRLTTSKEDVAGLM